MAELTISADDIQGAIEEYVESFTSDTSREEVGTVIDAGDGIAHVEGLPSVMTQELLEFPGGVLGVALNLDEHSIGTVILGDFEKIEEGQQVKRTGEVLSVPVGDAFLGRVVNPLGQPIDGARRHRSRDAPRAGTAGAVGGAAAERQGAAADRYQGHRRDDPDRPRPASADHRRPQDRQDRGLRRHHPQPAPELGDRRRSKQVRCVYVAIGQKGTTIASVRRALEEGGAMDYTTIVAAPASDSAGFKWLAPYTGSAIAQHWMYEGKHVLIVFDDLTKQAEAYRAISLLLRRPPGREAYPGDVFYLHSRLLERCGKLSDELGGGSLTGLPIIETKANDISAYIPTNVISITDGQCFLETDLFNQGVRPAINVGVSVSRVGGAAQIKAMKEVAGSLRLDLSQYRELESFAAFASDLDATSKAQLERGARLVELLKQPQYQPMPVEEQVVSIFLGTGGHLDSVPVEDVRRFETELLDHMRASEEKILEEIRTSQKLTEENENAAHRGHQSLQEGLRGHGRWVGGARRARRGHGRDGRQGIGARSRSRTQGRRTPRTSQEGQEVANDGCHTSRTTRADPLRGVDQEDHQGPGADRDVAHRQGAGPARNPPGPTPSRSPGCSPPWPPKPRWTIRCSSSAPNPSGPVFWWCRPTAVCAAHTTPASSVAPRSCSPCCGRRAKNPVLYTVGRKAQNYYTFRNWDITESWTGFSEQPQYENAAEIASTLVDAFMKGAGDDDDQQADDVAGRRRTAHRVLGVQVDDVADGGGPPDRPVGGGVRRGRPGPHTLYSFEPDATTLFEALLPRYLTTRVYAALLESAASELASRQRAMKSATDNADDLIKALTLMANRERQAQITQEISEIVGGANALADAAK